MTELDAGLVRRKLAVIVRNVADLAAVEGLSLAEYRRDRFRQKGVERLLQETVEAAVDVNLHLLRLRGGAVPTDHRGGAAVKQRGNPCGFPRGANRARR